MARKLIGLTVLLFFLVMGVALRQSARDKALLTSQHNQVLERLRQMEQARDEAAAEVERWKEEARAIEAEVRRTAARRPDGSPAQPQPGNVTAGAPVAMKPVPPVLPVKKGKLAFEDLPPAVQQAISRDFAGTELQRIGLKSGENKSAYVVGGSFPDGREYELALAPDGTVLRRATDLSSETAPEAIRQAVAQVADGTARQRLREILTEDGTFYEFAAKTESYCLAVELAADGTLLERDLLYRQGMVPDNLRQAVASVAPGLELIEAREITNRKGTRYEVEARNGDYAVGLELAEDGSLRRYKADLQKPKLPKTPQ